ncbi:HemK/PrmC family methyltransferase [Agrococcus sp. ProA11]|uniref:N5-glutamine methyltransferase family protein n=1 Tax=Agrococcus chionoecetis TaxID=3153752 RepID=UPI003261C405
MEMRDGEALVAALRGSGSVFAEQELAELQRAADESDVLEAIEMFVERRTLGEPIEHIVGSARFAELRIIVHPWVFVPRRRTELVATIVADRLGELAGANGTPRLLDFGCGSGAIAALATHRVPGIEVVAVDAEPNAVACARVNLPAALVVHASGPDALDDHRASEPFDVVAANLPYVPTAELALMPHEARTFEPQLALDGGRDGLDPLRAHAPAIVQRLRVGGIAVTEVAPHQVAAASAILTGVGFASVAARTDERIGATALVATR